MVPGGRKERPLTYHLKTNEPIVSRGSARTGNLVEGMASDYRNETTQRWKMRRAYCVIVVQSAKGIRIARVVCGCGNNREKSVSVNVIVNVNVAGRRWLGRSGAEQIWFDDAKSLNN
jgi:hypothetical protein